MPTPTIETLRHLKNAGVFSDVSIGAFPHTFKQYNLVYGFNGCGKTTLSRLLDSLSDGGLSPNLCEGAEFSFKLSDGSTPSHVAPENVASRHISVFNEDCVERTLTWKEGTARPIIYLGQEQAELASQLTALEGKEPTAGQEETLRSAEWSAAQRALETKRRDIARLIAEELALGRRYTAANLKTDYEARAYLPDCKLENGERKRLKETINRTDLPQPLEKVQTASSGETAEKTVQAVLNLSVAQVAIAALERRKDALVWVHEGLYVHEGENECLFCGNDLPQSRIEALQSALNSGFDALAHEIDAVATTVDQYKQSCLAQKERVSRVNEALADQKPALSSSRKDLLALLDIGLSAADGWQKKLAQKKANPDGEFHTRDLTTRGWDQAVSVATNAFNSVIDANNAALRDFSNEQLRARDRLKAHHLAEHQSSYNDVVSREQSAANLKSQAEGKLSTLRQEISTVREQLRSHGPAAAELNKLLTSYLGHSQISLKATDDGYQICRDGKVSRKPLSEGEKTAVAFCYFLTSLQSEGRRVSDLIVVLDDPISSLDTRAMTHVVALIRKRFSSVKQLFILTHNLEFMREMKKWLAKRSEKQTEEFLFIETGISTDGRRSSEIIKMPKLIREYESEYHYLYSLVRLLAHDADQAERFAYLMPNAIRKVLDIFLAFKEPGASGLEPKVDKLLQDHDGLDAARVKAMERLAQLESHSESIGDVTTFSAYTLSQVADAARCLLELIAIVDPTHKKAMDKLCS